MNRKNAKIIAAVAGLSSFYFLLKRRPSATVLSLAGLYGALKMLPAQYELFGKTVVISGGSRGLGLALARAFLKRGARVALLARHADELDQAKMKLIEVFGESISTDILTLTCDVTEKDEIKAAIDVIQEKFSTIHVFVNNAGSMLVAPLESHTREDMEAEMNIHFYAPFQITQELIPIFKSQGEGRIVNVSSIGGKVAVPHMSGYCASKYALAGFSQTVDAELRKWNVKAMTVYPGLMRTGSTIQAVVKGDHEKEFAWFTLLGWTPGLAVSPEAVAERVIHGLIDGDTEVVVSPIAKFAAFMNNLLPEITADFTALMNRFLPRGNSNERKTGAQSRGWIDRQDWAEPLRDSIAQVERDYNQSVHVDADGNLNIKH